MIIHQRRIVNVERHLGFLHPGTAFVLGVGNLDRFSHRLTQIGFTEKLELGEKVLPAKVGPVTRFNAEGRYVVHRDQPKETAYHMVWWRRVEFRGRHDTEEVWDWVDVPYQRYPRTFVEPPSLEIQLGLNRNNQLIAVMPAYEYRPENYEQIRHAINLLLEIFGECQVFGEEIEGIQPIPIKRLNWRILPPGEYPWESLENFVKPIVDQAREGNRPLIIDRYKTLNEHRPEFYAIGHGGFSGYIVFAFPSLHMYVLESIYPDNATYVLEEDWETLSQLSKAKILRNELHKDRIFHRKGWHSRVNQLFSEND